MSVPQSDFTEFVQLSNAARQQVNRAVNAELIDLYWKIGEYVSNKIATDAWGNSTVKALASYIQLHLPGLRGFFPQNICRMRQFYEAYCLEPKRSTLLRELPWSSNLHILTRVKQHEFYALNIGNRMQL